MKQNTKENPSIQTELDRMKECLRKSSSPVFFIGSGISRRYLGLPGWDELLRLLAEKSGADYDGLLKFCSKEPYDGSLQSPGGEEGRGGRAGSPDNERIASELEYFYFRMQDEGRAKSCSRRLFMREAIADLIKEASPEDGLLAPEIAAGADAAMYRRELAELQKTCPSAILTTNYDTFLEELFRDSGYAAHIGREASGVREEDGKACIYKIHGCVTQPESIVITREDYNEFFEKSKYLYAKVLTLFCECPLIFMGYSVSDRNIRDVLTTIVDALPPSEEEKFREHVWILGWSGEAGEERVCKKKIELLNGSSLEAVCFDLYDYTEFFRAIRSVTETRRHRELKFSISEDVIELLIRPLYGRQDSLKVAVRELLQNALDACRMRKKEKEERGEKESGAEIAVRLEKEGEDRFLEIRDNGIGMDAEDIHSHFLTVGKSNKKNRRLGTVGKYGIGVLSVFLAGDYAEVYTKKEGEEPLAFKLYIKDSQRQVSWIEEGRAAGRGSAGRFGDGSGTAVRLRLDGAQRARLGETKTPDGLLPLLGLDAYMTEEGTRITVTEASAGFTAILPSLPPEASFYRVNDEIRIYRAGWPASDTAGEEETEADSAAREPERGKERICARKNTVFFNGMISPATFNWGGYTMLQKKAIPFIALNIANLDEREDEFGVALSRESAELSGSIAEGIARGIYDMETDKAADLIKSRADSLREERAGAEGLKDTLQRECAVFGGCDILLEAMQEGERKGRQRLLVSADRNLRHLELWGRGGRAEEILRDPQRRPIRLCGYSMSKRDIADIIEGERLIAISVRYLDDYIGNATGPSNGLRAEAIRRLMEVLGIKDPWRLDTSEKVWNFIRRARESIRLMYAERSVQGLLWLKEGYRTSCEHQFDSERLILFESFWLENPADPAFCAMLQEKIKRQGLADLIRVQG